MQKHTKKGRRQFLRNTSLAALSIGALPAVGIAKSEREKSGDAVIVCDKTTKDLYGEGPFYTDNPPTMDDNQLAAIDEPGTRMIISGRIHDIGCSEFIRDAVIDVWHADDAGAYDNKGFKLRGITKSNEQGFYVFETIKPGKYLNGNDFRPSHIHFKITPPGFSTLTTQLYFEGDTHIPGDAAASLTSGEFNASDRIITLTENADGVLEGTWDIVIDGDGITGTNDIHLDKGIIYKVSPNPFSENIVIRYGVFRTARVGLMVYDTNARLVATLEEQTLEPEKYEVEWQPESALPNGHYFVALKINDLQVHYLKLVKNS